MLVIEIKHIRIRVINLVVIARALKNQTRITAITTRYPLITVVGVGRFIGISVIITRVE